MSRAELRERLSLDPRKFRRWLREAERTGLLRVKPSRRGPLLILTGIERAAEILGCESLGPRPMSIPAELLIGSGWRANMWGAFLASLGDGKVTISRAKLRELSGVPERTQARWEGEAGVIARANYAVSDRAAGGLEWERDFIRAHAFAWRDAASGGRVIAWRLPDTRIASGLLRSCANGRTRKINRELRGASFYKVRGRLRQLRIFRASLKAAERAARKICQPDQPRALLPVREMYWPRFRARRATIWSELRI